MRTLIAILLTLAPATAFAIDSDGDGIDDQFEIPLGDSDGDGLPDYLDPDDDNDTVPTLEEDVDGDGDARNDDSDLDGAPNYLDTDDDGDSIPTRNEDPDGNGNPQGDDTDGDGIPNYLDDDDDNDTLPTRDEDPNGDGNPQNDDTDGDGVANYLDIDDDNDGLSTPVELAWGIDPLDPDTDDDGLGDGVEVTIHGTDPRLYDTDGGGVGDGDEVAAGTDPLDPSDDLVVVDLTLAGPQPGQAGAVNTWRATGAAAGATVHVAWSTSLGAFPLPGCPGEQLDIANPRLLGSAVADNAGVADIVVSIPPGAQGQSAVFQAAQPASCAVSNLLVHTFD